RVTTLTLRDVTTELSTRGVSVKAEEVADSSAGNLEFFKNVSNDIGFAQAIRQYLTSLLSAAGRPDDSAGHNLNKKEENGLLKAKNIDLENKLKQLEEEKATFLGGTPTWLIAALPVMAALSVGVIAFFSLAIVIAIQRKSKKQNRFTKWL